MTDITELAQREKFEAWVMTQIYISKSTLEGLRTADGYRNSTLSGRDYNLMWNCWKAAGAELVEALEKARQRIGELEQKHCGGALMERELAHSEVINKLMSEIDNRDSRIAELDAELEREREKSRRVMSRIAELEASHAKLRDAVAAIHNTIRMDGAYTPLAAILNAAKRAHEESTSAAGIKMEVE